MAQFTIRVYGICINDRNEVLVSDETYGGHAFTKFPGGGLEYGEGTIDCLKREFLEEFNLDIAVGPLFYCTDFFQQSAFHAQTQVVSIYYSIAVQTTKIDALILQGTTTEKLRWISCSDLKKSDVTFPIDQVVCSMIVKKIAHSG